jgi:hypothetical protein
MTATLAAALGINSMLSSKASLSLTKENQSTAHVAVLYRYGM